MGGSFWGVSLPWWAAAAYGCATKGVVKVVTVAKRQKPPKRAEFIHQQDRAGFWTLAKRSKTPLLLGRWRHLGACRNRLCPARADKRARNGRFTVKTATKCQKPLWRAELCNNQVVVASCLICPGLALPVLEFPYSVLTQARRGRIIMCR